MYRIGFAILGCLLWACNGKDEKAPTKNDTAASGGGNGFGNQFTAAAVPYQLTDTALLNNKDTATLNAAYLTGLVPDTTLQKIFGKPKQVKYAALARMESKNKDAYYLVKATAGAKKAALLIVFDKDGNYATTTRFLVPDDDASTSQSSSIDKSFSVTKATTLRNGNDVVGEGKEVVAYDPKERKFSLIMTDLLNDEPEVLVNPLDTFPRTNRFAGDYYANKKNLVAVRDGRHANQILVYIHTENSEGDCKGELKGEFLITGATTAIYRQGGDPCILGLTFAGNSVSIKEESGCGNYRGLDCPLNGSFTRKKEEKPKEATKTSKRPKRA